MNYAFYVCDVETTGLDFHLHSPIEISIYRLSNDDQKTWLLAPINMETIDSDALRVNHHKMEDLKGLTKYGKDNYKEPKEVITNIENWLDEDSTPASHRILIGQNISFDRYMLENLWINCNAKDSFPFGRRFIDTMGIELFTDYCNGQFAEAYNLNALLKKHGLKNDKAHTASADTKATKELFIKQIERQRTLINSK
jgi:DNA polymerase III alpha subunit (gram-positive type)